MKLIIDLFLVALYWAIGTRLCYIGWVLLEKIAK